LAHCCRFAISDAIHAQAEGFYDLEREQKSVERSNLITEHMSRFKFEAFFNSIKEEKTEGGDATWAREVSPYTGKDVKGGHIDEKEEISDWEDNSEFLILQSRRQRDSADRVKVSHEGNYTPSS
jgi:hypothetical protein